MGLFGIPNLPPELLAMLANPKALGEQVKAFYVAATNLLTAIERHKAIIENGPEYEGEFEAADERVYAAADAFRAELAKLPPLDQVKQ
jgi:hypothetical protein